MSNSDTGGKILATIFSTPFVLLVAAAFGVYQVFAEGYCASVLWRWFAVPQGLRALPWVTFAGAACLLALTRTKLKGPEPKDERPGSERLTAVIDYLAAPWIILLVGWCIK